MSDITKISDIFVCGVGNMAYICSTKIKGIKLKNITDMITVNAKNAYDSKEDLKDNGFSWNNEEKCWTKDFASQEEYDAFMEHFMNVTYYGRKVVNKYHSKVCFEVVENATEESAEQENDMKTLKEINETIVEKWDVIANNLEAFAENDNFAGEFDYAPEGGLRSVEMYESDEYETGIGLDCREGLTWVKIDDEERYNNHDYDDASEECLAKAWEMVEWILDLEFDDEEEDEDLSVLAYNAGLDWIETCDNYSGYPSGLGEAIIGFKTYAEAYDFAEKHGLKVQGFEKKAGHQLWTRTGAEYGAIEVSDDLFTENYLIYGHSDAKDYYENEVKPHLQEFSNFEELKEFIADQERIFDEIECADDDEVVITHLGRYYDTMKEETMMFEFDGTTKVIGVA